MDEEYGALAALSALAVFSMIGRRRKPRNPEEEKEATLREAERLAVKEQAQYEAAYRQAESDNEEFDRAPRAFRRRYNHSKDGAGK